MFTDPKGRGVIKILRKTRSDKKHTIQTRLTREEMKVFGRFMLHLNFNTVLETANYCITQGLQEGLNTFIVDYEIDAVKNRKVKDNDTILVNARLDAQTYEIFKHVRVEFVLNQRQLFYILIWRILDFHNFNLMEKGNVDDY